MLSRHLCSTIAIVVATLVSAATTATARAIRADAAGVGTAVAVNVDTPDQCAEKPRGNSDWASLILNAGGRWPHYAFASRDYPYYYARGYCNDGPAAIDSYGFAPVLKGTRHRK
jgi:hypothetical protein